MPGLLARLAALDDLVLGRRGRLRPLARAVASAWPTTVLYALGIVVAVVGAQY